MCRDIFTTVFALGVGLAALGGVIGAPSTGLTTTLGDSLLINMLVALAIGGLTSYPGAAAGALIVGLLQQFVIKVWSDWNQHSLYGRTFQTIPTAGTRHDRAANGHNSFGLATRLVWKEGVIDGKHQTKLLY